MDDSERAFEMLEQGLDLFAIAKALGAAPEDIATMIGTAVSRHAESPEGIVLGDRALELFEQAKQLDEIGHELGIIPDLVPRYLGDAMKRRDPTAPPLSDPRAANLRALSGLPPQGPPPRLGPSFMPDAWAQDEWVIVERDPDPEVLEEDGESYLYVEFSDMVSDQHELIEGVARHLATLPGVENAWREDTELILVQTPRTEDEVLAAVKQWWSDHDGPTTRDEAG